MQDLNLRPPACQAGCYSVFTVGYSSVSRLVSYFRLSLQTVFRRSRAVRNHGWSTTEAETRSRDNRAAPSLRGQRRPDPFSFCTGAARDLMPCLDRSAAQRHGCLSGCGTTSGSRPGIAGPPADLALRPPGYSCFYIPPAHQPISGIPPVSPQRGRGSSRPSGDIAEQADRPV